MVVALPRDTTAARRRIVVAEVLPIAVAEAVAAARRRVIALRLPTRVVAEEVTRHTRAVARVAEETRAVDSSLMAKTLFYEKILLGNIALCDNGHSSASAKYYGTSLQ